MPPRFPFATVTLDDSRVPLGCEVTGWSPFEPNNADDSSLPVVGLEYRFTNRTAAVIEAVFFFQLQKHSGYRPRPPGRAIRTGRFLAARKRLKKTSRGTMPRSLRQQTILTRRLIAHGSATVGLTDSPWLGRKSPLAVVSTVPPITEGAPSSGATLFVPVKLAPGESKTIVVRLAWYTGQSNLRLGKDANTPPPAKGQTDTYRPWYAGRFANISEVTAYWNERYDVLRKKSKRFSDCFYDSTLPPEVVEAVAANLSILKSPTVLRQADGKLWAWEGCNDRSGSCHGTCTHVWNYAQAIPHLFPGLERTLRETEFGPSQDARGHQVFRAALPIRPQVHDFHAAADGQLGGIMKVFREWRISGDTEWLRRLWPKVKTSLHFCIETWDPKHKGLVEEPHHNTYDIEFWGPDGMCTSIYLGALRAAVLMGQALDDDVSEYAAILEKGIRSTEKDLFNGEYFFQRVEWKTLATPPPTAGASALETALLQKEGPKYQYGAGCLSDGVLGSWFAMVCGVGDVLDRQKVASHLKAVYQHNLKKDLSDHSNPQRPTYACGSEGGLLLCSWPKGGEPSLPFVYSNEVWTGIEYQVASHLMMMGLVKEGLEIVRTCRNRYDGRVRNPFNEYECGHWYARALSSYGLLQGLSGARYDAVEKTLHLQPRLAGDFRCFISTATGYGTVGVKNGKPFIEVKEGTIDVRDIKMT